MTHRTEQSRKRMSQGSVRMTLIRDKGPYLKETLSGMTLIHPRTWVSNTPKARKTLSKRQLRVFLLLLGPGFCRQQAENCPD